MIQLQQLLSQLPTFAYLLLINALLKPLHKYYTIWKRRVQEHCAVLIEEIETLIDEFGRSSAFNPITLRVSTKCEGGKNCVKFGDGKNALYIVVLCESNVNIPKHVLVHARHHKYDIESVLEELNKAYNECVGILTKLLREVSAEVRALTKGTDAEIDLYNLLSKLVAVNRPSLEKCINELRVSKQGKHYVIETRDGTKIAEVEDEIEAYKLCARITSLALDVVALYKVLDEYTTNVAEAREKLISMLNSFRNELRSKNYVAGWCDKCPIGKVKKAVTDFVYLKLAPLRRALAKVKEMFLWQPT